VKKKRFSLFVHELNEAGTFLRLLQLLPVTDSAIAHHQKLLRYSKLSIVTVHIIIVIIIYYYYYYRHQNCYNNSVVNKLSSILNITELINY